MLKHMPPRPNSDVGIATRRQMSRAYNEAFKAAMPVVPDIGESQLEITMRDGYKAHGILIKSNTPATSERPLIVLYFGGGFVVGSPGDFAVYGRIFARLFDAVVVLGNYRLAPEDPFPMAPNDAWDTLKWAAANASSLGANPSAGFVVGGGSAGANLTAVVAQLAKDEKLQPALTGQWLCIPAVFEEGTVPEKYKSQWFSREQNDGGGPMLDKEALDLIRKAYQYDEHSPLYSPVNSPSGLGGLPKTHLQVCGKDPLRDDGLIYDKMLRENGVETLLDVYPGVPHGVWAFFPMLKVSQKVAYDMAKGMGWLLGERFDDAEMKKLLKLPVKIM